MIHCHFLLIIFNKHPKLYYWEGTIYLLVQAVRGFSVHFWKKLPFFAQMISNMYSFDPDIAQSILTVLTPNQHVISIHN